MPAKPDKFRERRLIEALPKRRRVTIDELPPPSLHINNQEGETPKQEVNFIRYWMVGYGNAATAAIKAGYPAVVARQQAWSLLAEPRIKRRLAEMERELMDVSHLDAETLFRDIVIRNLRLASATPPVEVWTPPCRYCYGDNYEYQRTHAEFEEDFDRHVKKPIRLDRVTGKPHRVPLFDPKGGPGYDVSLPPNQECPECHGRGDFKRPIVKIKDTRFYTAEERELFQGAKSTKDGVEVFWKDQSQARTFLNDLALRMAEYRKPEDAIDITDMSPNRLRQFLLSARDQGYEVDPDILAEEAGD